MAFLRIFGKSPKEGAQTSIFCCVDETLQNTKSGYHYVDCHKVELQPWLIDERKQKLLWDVSKKLVNFD